MARVKINYKLLLLLVCVALFLAHRGGLLLYGYSHIAHPSFDDTVSGVLAHDFLTEQIRAPLFAYHSLGRTGHELMEGILLVPFFKLLGHSLFSQKILYLFSNLMCLLCWIFLIKRYQGIGAALLFAGFFAFPPLMFARLNMMLCSRPFINLLMVVQLIFLFRIIETKETSRGSWLWVACGLSAGLGSYMFYTHVIFNCFVLLFLFVFASGKITFRRVLLFAGGFCAGFSPWVFRSFYSSAGGNFLGALLQSVKIDPWSFVQNFVFNVPHAFGYHYPSRDMGIISPLYYLFIIFLSGVIVINFFQQWLSTERGALKNEQEKFSPAILQGIFFVGFPFFFIVCLSLSPLQIMPFEYWPSMGFFGSFSCADVFRYRWFSSLFPFCFGIVAVGTVTVFRTWGTHTAWKVGMSFTLAFFLLSGIVTPLKLYSKNDFKKVLYYKGYSYYEMARRFILSDIDFLNLAGAQQFALDYPEESRGDAYRRLGTKSALVLSNHSDSGEQLEKVLQEVPLPYLDDFIDGVVRAAYPLSVLEFQPFENVLAGKFPAAFYEKWGFSYFGRKYYGLLLNWEKIRTYTFPLEESFFKGFLDNVTHPYRGPNGDVLRRELFDQLSRVPLHYQRDVVRGIGMAVGAAMLFDPLSSPDYPLDSRFGEHFRGDVREAFYEGIGGGFADMLIRFFSTLLLPDDLTSPLYEKRLDIEWTRCLTLMSRVSPSQAPFIKKGFLRELNKREMTVGLERYLEHKQWILDSARQG